MNIGKVKYTFGAIIVAGMLLLVGCGAKGNDENVDANKGNTEVVTESTTEISENTETNQEISTETEVDVETETPTETEETVEPERYVVNTETVTETIGTEPFKYGLKKTSYVIKKYNVYNDGSKELIGQSNTQTYDTTGYNATDDDLQAEVEALVNANMAYYQEVVRLVNEIRAEAGVDPVELDLTLCKAATMRSVEMTYAQYFEHKRADGRSCFSAISYYGYSRIAEGENIGVGQSTAQYVVERWKGSPGHYQNMIRPNFTKLGVGFCDVSLGTQYQKFWTQLFAQEYVFVEPDWSEYEDSTE